MSDEPSSTGPATARTTVRRGARRARYERSATLDILRRGIVAHVGVVTDSGPVVLPMAYGLSDDTMYLHGAQANSLLAFSVDAEICATVTIVDGLVLAKTPFNHSMNYRSVVVRGRGRRVIDDDEVLLACRLITDHIVPTWETTRSLSPGEIRATRIVALSLDEMSGKVRSGGAVNDVEDEVVPVWSGHLPIIARFGQPVATDDAGADVPVAVRDVAGRDVHGARDADHRG